MAMTMRRMTVAPSAAVRPRRRPVPPSSSSAYHNSSWTYSFGRNLVVPPAHGYYSQSTNLHYTKFYYFSSMTDDLQHFARTRTSTAAAGTNNKTTPNNDHDPDHPTNNDNHSNNNPNNRKSKYHLPKRIILLRHGESLGNIDENAYASIPDWKIPLTRRGERQAIRAANELSTLLDGESLFCYCSPYKRTMDTWKIIEQQLYENNNNMQQKQEEDDEQSKDDNEDDNDNDNQNRPTKAATKGGVEIIGMREEPRIAEQQFGNFQNPKKVRTAKSERRMFGRFFFRFPNGEAGLDVYNRVSSFLATLSRDIRQIDQLYSIRHYPNHVVRPTDDDSNHQQDSIQAASTYPLDDIILPTTTESLDPSSPSPFDDPHYQHSQQHHQQNDQQHDQQQHHHTNVDAMEHMNILIVTHGLTLRLLLMRYFQLSVEEFENSYNSQNARLVIMDRFVVGQQQQQQQLEDNNGTTIPTTTTTTNGGNGDDQREFYRLHDTAKEALNLKGDVSNEKPVYWRSTAHGDDSSGASGGGTNHHFSSSSSNWGSSCGVTHRHLGGLWSYDHDDVEE